MKNVIGKASVLAIGTELTTGQITNRNASWISEKLVSLGMEVVLHETVADDRPMIREALDHCAKVSQFTFVTGGLGPTTDDFTREVIADWLGKKLEFNEESWQKIVARLSGLGIPVAESNRQQCYFPAGAQILANPEGTAAGFSASIPDGKKIWIFPGPPREIAAIWEQGIDSDLKKLLPTVEPLRLLSWKCLGKSEAELGEITEKALAGSHLQTGYRAHRPFVEIKVWCPEKDLQAKEPWLEKLKLAIAPWVMTSQGEDLAVGLLMRLQRSENIEIIDSGSGGALTARLGAILREKNYQEQAETISIATQWARPTDPQDWLEKAIEQADEEATTLIIAGFTDDGRCAIGLREDKRIYREFVQLPYTKIELIDRMRHYAVELAMKKWSEWLDTATN
jgi:nicotinamide-nucleotide amidase